VHGEGVKSQVYEDVADGSSLTTTAYPFSVAYDSGIRPLSCFESMSGLASGSLTTAHARS
jgi:hypothetical protein